MDPPAVCYAVQGIIVVWVAMFGFSAFVVGNEKVVLVV